MKKNLLQLTLICLAVLQASSCANMSKKFTAQTKANISLFADQTIAILSNADFSFNRGESLYTREFFDLDGKEEREVFHLRRQSDDLFKTIIRYSLGLVSIVEAKKTEAEKVATYHEFLGNVNNELLEKLEVTPDLYADIMQKVADAEEFLEALRAAQPLFNAAGRYMYQNLEQLERALEILRDKLDGRIDEEYAEVIRYQEALETEKYNILKSLAYLYRAYKGNMEAYALLKETESIFRKDLIVEPPPSDGDLAEIAEYLRNRLRAIHVVEEEIKNDWDTYRAAHRELDALYDKARDNIDKSRLIMLLWLRAHQKMASGVVGPAEWFDINSLPAKLLNMGTNAAF